MRMSLGSPLQRDRARGHKHERRPWARRVFHDGRCRGRGGNRGAGLAMPVPTKNFKSVEKSGDLFRSAVVSPACIHSCRNSSHGSPVVFAAALNWSVVALRHQLAVVRRQRPGRTPVFRIDRLERSDRSTCLASNESTPSQRRRPPPRPTVQIRQITIKLLENEP
jgi:hypothetical protein